MDLALTVAGALLVVGVLREVFHTLFHPSGRGALSLAIFKATWHLSGHLGPRARSVAGPLAMVATILAWVALLVLGWALIYLPALPEGFTFAPPGDAERAELADAVYVSWVTQSTLGYGDITPATEVLRILAPLQATLGFALFTMAVTWVLSVYPALHRQRALAATVHGLRRTTDQGQAPGIATAVVLDRISEGLASVTVDLLQYPATFYFSSPKPDLALSEGLPYLRALSDGASGENREAAARLATALETFSDTVGETLLSIRGKSTDEVISAYCRHYSA